MNPDYFSQNYEFSTIKNNATYNGERLRIREMLMGLSVSLLNTPTGGTVVMSQNLIKKLIIFT